MTEEWGPWIEHDGQGCPCVGQFVHIVYVDGVELKARATGGASWNHVSYAIQISRYRIRKPKGLTILEQLLADLPEPLSVPPHALIEANSPASTTHGPALGLFIPTLCAPTAREGGEASSSLCLAATYSARAA